MSRFQASMVPHSGALSIPNQLVPGMDPYRSPYIIPIIDPITQPPVPRLPWRRAWRVCQHLPHPNHQERLLVKVRFMRNSRYENMYAYKFSYIYTYIDTCILIHFCL